jgi:hypothetical protein
MDFMGDEVNVLALVRGEEQYIFVFDPSRRTELLRLLGRYAADPELAFNWLDAAILSQKIREIMPASVAASGAGNPAGGISGSGHLGAGIHPPAPKSAPRFQFPRS